MLAIRQRFEQEAPRSFSYLYLSNVAGAILGALVPPLLIELRGFHGTLKIAAVLNCLLAVSATALSLARKVHEAEIAPRSKRADTSRPLAPRNGWTLALLFATGLTSMGMEVVWIRQFTFFLGTMVYAFAAILGIYLTATIVGSQMYRYWSQKQARQEEKLIWACLGATALLPLVTADPRIEMATTWRLALGIAPFSGILGFLTPMLVDRWSSGDPNRAGNAYAVNVLGCILGPLLSGFVLLPLMSEHWVLTLLSLPWLFAGIYPQRPAEAPSATARRYAVTFALSAVAVALVVFAKDYQVEYPQSRILRDDTATVPPRGERSMAGLFSDLAQEASRLFRQQVALARAELAEKFRQLGAGVAELAVGGFLLYAGFLVLLQAAVFALALVLPLWVAALIVGSVTIGLGGLVLLKGRRDVGPRRLMPDRTLRSLREDREWAREQMR
jgi:hypothetical protein